jgi:hypothetical protein
LISDTLGIERLKGGAVSSAYYDLDPLEDLLELLIATKRIKGEPIETIAKHVIAFGEDAMTTRERIWFEKEIRPLLKLECALCRARLDLAGVREAYLNEMQCGRTCCDGCAHALATDDGEQTSH